MTGSCGPGAGVPLALELPDEIMALLEQAARHDLRTPEAEAAWLLRDALTRLDTVIVNSRTRRERLRDSGPLREQLSAAIMAAGKPSHREIARTAEARGYSISHTTVSEILRGAHFPSWRLVEAIAFALNTRPDRFRAAWEKAAE